jgi:tetratricopeptide (TPR) repeat protein
MTNRTPAWCVGRTGEVDQLGRLFERYRLLTIVAPGGMGKTRLAQKFASLRDDMSERETWFVPLADVSSHISDFVAEKLGVQVERLEHMLQNRIDVFIILDNAEHALEEVREFVDGLLTRVPHVRVLVTSRQPLGLPDEAILRLGPLEPVPAREVLMERAERYGITLEADDTLDLLLKGLGGIPLALELAASRLLTHDVATLAEDTETDVGVLQSTNNEFPERHRQLDRVLSASWDDLTPELRKSAARLSMFVDTFDLDAALVVSDIDRVGALVRHSWVERNQTPKGIRFRIPGLLRAFGREQMKLSTEEDALRALIVRHFLDRDNVAGQSRCAPEWMDNLFVMAPLLSDLGLRVEAVLALEYPARLRFAFRRWDNLLKALLGEPSLADQGQMPADQGQITAYRARLLDARSLAAMALSQTEDSRTFSDEAWKASETVDDEALKASILISLGMAAAEQGDSSTGVARLEEAVARAKACGSIPVQIRALQKLAMPRFVSGQIQEALDAAQESTGLAEKIDDDYERGRALAVTGVIQMGTGDFAAARASMGLALELQTRLEDSQSMILSVTNLGNLFLIEGRLDEAFSCFERSLQWTQKSGNAVAEATSLEGLAWVHFERGEVAISLLEEAARLAEPYEAFFEQIEIFCALTIHHLRLHQFGAAKGALASASRLAQTMQIPGWTSCVAALGALTAAMGKEAGAAETHMVAARTYEEIDWKWHEHAIAFLMDGKPFDAKAAMRAADVLDAQPWRCPPAWIRHNPIRICLQLLQTKNDEAVVLQLSADARIVVMPDGTEHDFSRRGPLRLIVLELARRSHIDQVMSVDDVIQAGWPGEMISPDAARLRVYTTIKRMRNIGFSDLIETTDEGYRLHPGLKVVDYAVS